MKIGIDARAALLKKKGGFGVYARNLIQSMIDLYPDFYFDITHCNNPEHLFKQSENIQHTQLKFPIKSLWTQLRLPFYLRKNSPDIFLFPYQTLSKFSLSKKIVTIHDLRYKVLGSTTNKSESLRLHLQMKNNIKYSDKVICVSNQTRSDLVNHYDIDEEKIKVIYHGADHLRELKDDNLKIFPDELMKKYKVPKNYMLTVGFTMKHKNILSAIQCLNKLINLGHDINLVIAGPIGDDEKNIANYIDKLGVKERIIRIYFVDLADLPYLYHYSKFFLFPSAYEGFGFPILEAMRSGAIVIGNRAGSIPEIGGNAAVYFNSKDIDDMVQKCEDVLSNKINNNQLRINGYKRAKFFTWKKVARETVGFFEE